MNIDKTSLYTPDSSLVKQVIDNSAVRPSPASDVIRASEFKLTPTGPSPTEVVASQVRSLNPEQRIDSSPVTVRAY